MANILILVPDLEQVHPESSPNNRAASTPIVSSISKDQFDVLCGRVDDLFAKFLEEQEKMATSKDSLSQMERKIEHLEGNVVPDLKVRIKTVKKAIPSDATLPTKNKEILEQVRAGMERARAKIAVLEQQKPDQKFKLSETSIAALVGEY